MSNRNNTIDEQIDDISGMLDRASKTFESKLVRLTDNFKFSAFEFEEEKRALNYWRSKAVNLSLFTQGQFSFVIQDGVFLAEAELTLLQALPQDLNQLAFQTDPLFWPAGILEMETNNGWRKFKRLGLLAYTQDGDDLTVRPCFHFGCEVNSALGNCRIVFDWRTYAEDMVGVDFVTEGKFIKANCIVRP